MLFQSFDSARLPDRTDCPFKIQAIIREESNQDVLIIMMSWLLRPLFNSPWPNLIHLLILNSGISL